MTDALPPSLSLSVSLSPPSTGHFPLFTIVAGPGHQANFPFQRGAPWSAREAGHRDGAIEPPAAAAEEASCSTSSTPVISEEEEEPLDGAILAEKILEQANELRVCRLSRRGSKS